MSARRSDLSEFSTESSEPTSERQQRQRREVANDIVSAAYLRGNFELRSGERSNFYFDKYLFETKPTILRRLAEMLAERVPAGIDRLAGTEVGGIALVAAVSLATGIPFVIVRNAEAINASTSELIRGELHADELVLLVQDVVDTGNQATESATKVRKRGAHISGVLSVIDRQSGGVMNICAAGYHYDSLFSLDELEI